MLREFGCREAVLIHLDKRSKRKTDRRDAGKLSELLWLNREGLSAGEKPQGLRRVCVPPSEQQQDRPVTALRQRVGQQRTRSINKIKNMLRRHNLTREQPTRTFQTKNVRHWLEELELGEMDHLEMDQLLAQWDLWKQQLGTTRGADRRAFCAKRIGPAAGHRSGGEWLQCFDDRVSDRIG